MQPHGCSVRRGRGDLTSCAGTAEVGRVWTALQSIWWSSCPVGWWQCGTPHVGVGGHYILSPWLVYGGEAANTISWQPTHGHTSHNPTYTHSSGLGASPYCAQNLGSCKTRISVISTTAVSLERCVCEVWVCNVMTGLQFWCRIGSGRKTRLNTGIDK